MKRIHNDFHVHTVFSGHSSSDMTVSQILPAAKEAGMHRLLVLEHTPQVNSIVREAIREERFDPRRTNRFHLDTIAEECQIHDAEVSPMKVFVGAEVDADPNTSDGTLLLRDCSELDVVMASTHYLPNKRGFLYDSVPWSDPDKMRIREEWMVWAMRIAANPRVNILAHPGALLCQLGAVSAFEGDILEDFSKLLQICKKYETAFELNELLLRKKMKPEQANTYHEVIALARDLEVPISTGSDAHHKADIGQFPLCEAIAEYLDLKEHHFWVPPSKPA